MNKKKKGREGVVYSTDPDFEYDYESGDGQDTSAAGEQHLLVRMERQGRKGKTVTVVLGFIGSEEDLLDVGRSLKQYCGAGGSAKDGEIVIQGDHVQKVKDWLLKEGYGVK